jgi:hypothetical protein
LTRGFDRFVTSTTAPAATGRSDSYRVGIAPTQRPRLCTAHCNFRASAGTGKILRFQRADDAFIFFACPKKTNHPPSLKSYGGTRKKRHPAPWSFGHPCASRPGPGTQKLAPPKARLKQFARLFGPALRCLPAVFVAGSATGQRGIVHCHCFTRGGELMLPAMRDHTSDYMKYGVRFAMKVSIWCNVRATDPPIPFGAISGL